MAQVLVRPQSQQIYSQQKVGATRVPMDAWMGKQNVAILTVGYDSALKRKETATPATAQVGLADACSVKGADPNRTTVGPFHLHK